MIANELKIRRIAFAGSVLDIEYRGKSAERVLTFLFRDLAQAEMPGASDPSAHFTYRLETDPESGVLRLYSGVELERECTSEADMALYLVGQVCYQLASFSTGGLVMHAALVGQNGQGILLPGATGKGKSTLTAWLLRCGYDYLTDELVFMPNGEVQNGYGLARPLNIKKVTCFLLNDLFRISSASLRMMSNASVDLIPHELFGNGNVFMQIPICVVIFPCFQAGCAFELRRLSKAQAGFELMQCLINARNLLEHGFPNVINLARSIPAYQMVYGDFTAVEAAVQTVLKNSSFTL
jgi:hypothetical protein